MQYRRLNTNKSPTLLHSKVTTRASRKQTLSESLKVPLNLYACHRTFVNNPQPITVQQLTHRIHGSRRQAGYVGHSVDILGQRLLATA